MQVGDSCNLLLHYYDLEGWLDDPRGSGDESRHDDYATEEKVRDSYNYTREAQMTLAYAAEAGFKVLFMAYHLGKSIEVDTTKRTYIVHYNEEEEDDEN